MVTITYEVFLFGETVYVTVVSDRSMGPMFGYKMPCLSNTMSRVHEVCSPAGAFINHKCIVLVNGVYLTVVSISKIPLFPLRMCIVQAFWTIPTTDGGRSIRMMYQTCAHCALYNARGSSRFGLSD